MGTKLQWGRWGLDNTPGLPVHSNWGLFLLCSFSLEHSSSGYCHCSLLVIVYGFTFLTTLYLKAKSLISLSSAYHLIFLCLARMGKRKYPLCLRVVDSYLSLFLKIYKSHEAKTLILLFIPIYSLYKIMFDKQHWLNTYNIF